jgi:hypothetical protein
MVHPRDEDAYPVGTIVRLKKNGQLAKIVDRGFLMGGKNFLHYLGEIEGRPGRYALYHDDLELVSLPKT